MSSGILKPRLTLQCCAIMFLSCTQTKFLQLHLYCHHYQWCHIFVYIFSLLFLVKIEDLYTGSWFPQEVPSVHDSVCCQLVGMTTSVSIAGWDARLLRFPPQLHKVCSVTLRVVLTQSDFLWSSTRDPILKTPVYWESNVSKDSKRRMLERLQQKDSCNSWVGDGNIGLWCCRSHPNINACTLRPVFNLGQRWILKCFYFFFFFAHRISWDIVLCSSWCLLIFSILEVKENKTPCNSVRRIARRGELLLLTCYWRNI